MDSAVWGLVGALIGGAASLLATWMSNRHARKLAQMDRLDDAVVQCRAAVFRLERASRSGLLPSADLLDDVVLDVKLTAARSKRTSPHFATVLDAIALVTPNPSTTPDKVKAVGPWAAAVGEACQAWLSDPIAFERTRPTAQSFFESSRRRNRPSAARHRWPPAGSE